MEQKKENYRLFKVDELREMCMQILEKNGVVGEDADILIDSLMDAEMKGISSHGVNRLVWYSERLANGGIKADAKVKVVKEAGTVAVVDGDNGLGAVVSHFAMNKAISMAEEYNIAVVGVRNSNHFGTAAYWSEMASKKGMIGISLTNGGVLMAPWGGLTRLLSANPISISIPMGETEPITLDVSMSKVAGGKLDIAAKKGEKIPFGWALTKEGLPTDDPVEGRRGLFLPIGDHKGYGLALMFEVLQAILTGSNFSSQIQFPPKPGKKAGVGHYFQVLNVKAFMPEEEFVYRMTQLKEIITSSKLAPGVERIYMPGEIEHMKHAESMEKGIMIPVNIAKQLHELAYGK